MIKESAGGIVINSKNQILVVYEDDFDGWVLPKGHIESDETEEDAAKREILEESGVIVGKPIKKLGVIKRKEFGTGATKLIHYYLYRTDDGKLSKGAKWLDMDDAANLYFKEEREFVKKNKGMIAWKK